MSTLNSLIFHIPGGRDYRYNYWAPDNNEVLNNVRPSPPLPGPRSATRGRGEQESSSGSLRWEMQAIRRQVTDLAHLCTNMAQTQQEQQHNHQQQQNQQQGKRDE